MAATKRKGKVRSKAQPGRNGNGHVGTLRNRVVERRQMLGADLAQNSRNWRTHPTAQAAALRAILEEVGMAGELLAYHSQRNGGKLTLIDGHLRSAEFAGELWDVAITDLDDAEADKLLAAHDPLAAMAGADKDRLDALLRDVQTGSEALAGMLTELAAKSGIVPGLNGQVPEDQGPQIDRAAELLKKWRVERDQLWLIPSKTAPGGVHRLLCGDSTVPQDVARVMGGERAGLCFTSPPYNAGEYKLTGNVQKRDKSSRYAGQDDDRSEADYLALLTGFTTAALSVCDVVAVNVQQIAGNKVAVLRWAAHFAERFVDRAIWYKGSGNPAMARNVMDSRFEDIWLFAPQDRPSRAIPTADFRGTVQNVFECSGASKDNTVPGEHAATMPVAVCRWALESWSLVGAVAYDPFLGSGTTIVAAEQTGRLCYGVEIEPKYVAVTLERLTALGLTPRPA